MTSMINEEDLKEFRQEGAELLEAAEKALLSLEDGGHYPTQYNAIFRAFHNLKGAAGMMEMTDLQGHTHILETELVSLKEVPNLSADQVDYFLKGIDAAKKLLWGQSVEVDSPATAAAVTPAAQATSTVQNAAPTPAPTPVETEKQKQSVLEPTRILLFSDSNELEHLEDRLKSFGFEVRNHADYIDGITKYDTLRPQVIFISPKFSQTSPDELKSILKKDGHIQLFIDSNFVNTPVDLLVKYIRCHFENINLRNLAAEAAHLLKFQYADLCDYLKSQGKEHIEKNLTEEMRDFLSYKSMIAQKFKEQ